MGEALRSVYGLDYQIEPPSPLPQLLDPARNQYRAWVMLETLPEAPGQLILTVVDVDLYAPGLNFIFGMADPGELRAIVSLHRLHGAGLISRARKEAIHEVGHCLGLGHCADPSCVMHFSNTLADTDRKSELLCPRCRRRLGYGD